MRLKQPLAVFEMNNFIFMKSSCSTHAIKWSWAVSSSREGYYFCWWKMRCMDSWFLLKYFLHKGEWVRVERIKIRKAKWLIKTFCHFGAESKNPYNIKEKPYTNFETVPTCWNDSRGFKEFNIRSLVYLPCKTFCEHLKCITSDNRTHVVLQK